MHTTHLRKVGSSIMLVIPPELLDKANLEAGSSVSLAIDHGRLIIEARLPPRYTLAELLAKTDPEALAAYKKDDAFLNSPPVGRELI